MFPYQKNPENKITFIFVASHDTFDSFDGDDQKWAQGQDFIWRLKYTRHDMSYDKIEMAQD